MLEDTARFELADDAAVVEASFCCQLCLRRTVLVIVEADEDSGHASCYCALCRAHTDVALNATQVLRLRLAPPPAVPIQLIPDVAIP